jgi:hypothetical protein
MPAQAIEPDVLPPDTEGVLTFNLRQLLNSDLAKAHPEVVGQIKTMIEGHLADLGAQRYIEKLDFDLIRDLDTITVATSGGKTPDFILLEGRFNPEKFQATGAQAAEENADHIKPIKLAGLAAFEIRIDANENPMFAGLVGKDKLIAVPTKDAFGEAVTRLRNSRTGSTKLKKELRDVLTVSGTKASLTVVSTGPALVKLTEDAPVPNIEALAGVLQGISALNVSLTVTKSVNFELAINTKDKKSADEMAKLAEVGLAGAKLMLKKKAETDAKLQPAVDVVNSMRVTSQENNLVLRGEITAETLGKVLKDLPK